VQLPAALAWAVLCHAQRASAPSEARREPDASPGPAPLVPDHTLLKRVGRGAYGEVWLARDIIGAYHAVKVIRRRNFPNAEPFEREFHGMEKFTPISRSHPGLLHILHVGRNDAEDYFYYIMEAADDEIGGQQFDPLRYTPRTLAQDIQRRGYLPVRECVQLGLALSATLQYLHDRNLIHRDIKPSNIVFVEGRPKFADIGLVTNIATPDHRVTRIGTEGFIAPEGPGTPAGDVYSLGKVLYEVSMGRDCGQFPEFPTTLGFRPDQGDLRQLHDLILTACEADPQDRYPTATAMHEALEALWEEPAR
jgi:serine/threonine protein kinase